MRIEGIRIEPGAMPERLRLTAEVLFADGQRETWWLDYPAEFRNSLNMTGDPWIVAALPLAMTRGESLAIEGPVDAKLLTGSRRLQAVWKSWHPQLHLVQLEVQAESRTPGDQGPVGAFFSGGVDSFHTLLRNVEEAAAGLAPPIEDLVLLWGADLRLSQADAFERLRLGLDGVAAAFGKRLIDVATNLRDTRWGRTDWTRLSHGAFLAAAGLGLGRHRLMLIPSSIPYARGMKAWGSHPYSDMLFSSSRTEFFDDSSDLDRHAKTAVVARNPIALGALRVCWRSGTERNCGHCLKCLRTMIALEVIGALGECRAFPEAHLELAKVEQVLCEGHTGYAMLSRLRIPAILAGRNDIVRALDRAFHHSARVDLLFALLDRARLFGIAEDRLERVKLALTKNAIRE